MRIIIQHKDSFWEWEYVWDSEQCKRNLKEAWTLISSLFRKQ